MAPGRNLPDYLRFLASFNLQPATLSPLDLCKILSPSFIWPSISLRRADFLLSLLEGPLPPTTRAYIEEMRKE